MPPARGQRTVSAGGAAPAVDDAAAQLYSGAYGDYLDERYELCVQGFEEYLRLYPTSASADNSLYWTGMCQRQLGRMAEARRAFQQVVADYPDSEVAADAVFNDALILVELGRTDDAIESFRRLIQAYPDRDAAFLACGQITELGGEAPEVCQQ
jgi:tol-pal system protein YbgF